MSAALPVVLSAALSVMLAARAVLASGLLGGGAPGHIQAHEAAACRGALPLLELLLLALPLAQLVLLLPRPKTEKKDIALKRKVREWLSVFLRVFGGFDKVKKTNVGCRER